MNVAPCSATSRSATCLASSSDSPWRTTVAPLSSVLATLFTGVPSGITMVDGIPSSVAWWATAWAWFPADMATTPARASSGVRANSRLRAPRSLNDAVYWRFSNLIHTSAPVMAERVRERAMGVRTTAPAMARCAACTSSKVTGRRPSYTTRMLSRLPSRRGERAPTHVGSQPWPPTKRPSGTRRSRSTARRSGSWPRTTSPSSRPASPSASTCRRPAVSEMIRKLDGEGLVRRRRPARSRSPPTAGAWPSGSSAATAWPSAS